MKHRHTLNLTRPGFPSAVLKFNVRPGIPEFMKRVKDKFFIVLMTASHRSYAEVMVKYLDPEGIYFKSWLSKEHCVNFSKGR